jgi:predicted phosphodiesterase
MRLALLSDVHGNLTALRAVVAAVEASSCAEGAFDHVIVAGDFVQGGPRPREVWSFLQDLRWTLVRGNHDEDVAGLRTPSLEAGWSEAGIKQLEWTRTVCGPDLRRALGSLPLSVRVSTPAGDLLVVHSSPRDTNDKRGAPHNTLQEIEAAYGGTGASAIAYGHWHASFVRTTPVGLLINVASVGLPKSGLPLAAYTVLTASNAGWCVEQRQVPYDAHEEEHAGLATGMPPWEPGLMRTLP